MITCDRCKTENLDGSQYCDECGAPLRPSGHHGIGQKLHNNGGGQNGSHTPAPGQRPEFAAGHVSAGLNLNALKAPPKPHARLVIEKGRSSGKQFMLNDIEAHIGRWDADGGIFPDVDLDTDDPEAKVSRRHARKPPSRRLPNDVSPISAEYSAAQATRATRRSGNGPKTCARWGSCDPHGDSRSNSC